MARKREQGFDPDKFLERYEENASHTTSASETPVPSEASVSSEKAAPDKTVADGIPLSNRELEYMESFILKNKYRRISRKGRQVYISEEFKLKMQKMMLFFSDGGSITEYVNNVLEQHFKEYDDIIKRMFNDSLKFRYIWQLKTITPLRQIKNPPQSLQKTRNLTALCFWSREKSGREKEYSFPVSLLTGSK